jgi:A/G-specific adenine glycosylase
MSSGFPSNALLDWFSHAQRTLPWRKNYDPYHVWVSEIMAQQTRIKQMLPYYERFLTQFPTIRALADADSQSVLKAWEGLGYYSRARNLQHAAQQIVNEKKGKIPQTKKELLALKGFGPYISSAVASIAFNENVPVVDGNVLRVSTRFWGVWDDVTLPPTRKKIEEMLQEVLPKGNARAFNQALMELGALICVPENPLCEKCPLRQSCYAFVHGKQSYFPVKTKKGKVPIKHFAMLILEKGGKYALHQRTEKLLHGMWEFPMVEFSPLCDSAHEIETKFSENGINVKLGPNKGLVSHAYSHFTQYVHVFSARPIKTIPVEWASREEMEKKPLSKVQQKVMKHVVGATASHSQ